MSKDLVNPDLILQEAFHNTGHPLMEWLKRRVCEDTGALSITEPTITRESADLKTRWKVVARCNFMGITLSEDILTDAQRESLLLAVKVRIQREVDSYTTFASLTHAGSVYLLSFNLTKITETQYGLNWRRIIA
jgi:hypothetical protein